MRRNHLIGNVSTQFIADSLNRHLEIASNLDLSSSATLRFFKQEPKLAKKILVASSRSVGRDRMLDLGCGYGLATKLVGNGLGFKEIHGIDMDDNRIQVAQKRISKVHKANLETDRLPFPDEHFDMVISFGVLEHLRFYDNAVKEAHRVLKQNGIFMMNIPNLGCWINRLLLLFGFHPRDVDVSDSLAVGLPGFWPKDRREAFAHIHACTLKAMTELLENYGFATLSKFGIAGVQDALSNCQTNVITKTILKAIDKILSRRASLSLRFFIIAQKTNG